MERIYQLAGVAGAAQQGELTFAEVVDRAIEALAAEMALPAFEVWVEAYRADPQRYDQDMAGFWRDVVS